MFDARQLTIACEVPSPEAQAILIPADQGIPRWYLAAFARDLTIDVTFGVGDSPIVLFREHLEIFLGQDLHVVSRFFLEKHTQFTGQVREASFQTMRLLKVGSPSATSP